MPAILVQEAASRRLDEIYRHTRERWGEEQAERYIEGLFAAFEALSSHGGVSRPIPAEFGVDGFYFRYESHFVYWRRLGDGRVAIVTILHARMHQMDRFRDDSRT